MNSLTNELKQIEGKVIEISRLQGLFSDKVLNQVWCHLSLVMCVQLAILGKIIG